MKKTTLYVNVILAIIINLISVTSIFAYDFILSNASTNSTSVEAGENLEVSFDMEFQDSYMSSASANYRCYLSTDNVLNTDQDIKLFSKYSTLTANQTTNKSRTVNIPFELPVGNYYVFVDINVSSGETNTNNNVDFVQITVNTPSISTKFAKSCIYDLSHYRYLFSQNGFSNIIEKDTLGNLKYFRTGGTDKYGDMCITNNKLCVIANDKSIMEFDLDNGDLLRTYTSSTQDYLKGIEYDSTNSYLYVSGMNGISIIEYASFTDIKTIHPSNIEGRPYWDSQNNRLLFGNGTDIYEYVPSNSSTNNLNTGIGGHIESITKDKRGNYYLAHTNQVLFYGNNFNSNIIKDTIYYNTGAIKYNFSDDILIICSKAKTDVLQIPVRIPLSHPNNNASFSSKSVNLIWKDKGYLPSTYNDTIKYQYEVSLSNNFSSKIASGSTTENTILISNLLNQNTYYWRVKAIINSLDYVSMWSDTLSFDINNSITSTTNNTINELAYEIYPNPTTGIFKVVVSGKDKGVSTKLSITDITGKVILTKDLSCQHNPIIDLSLHTKGIYFIRIQDREKIINKKIVIQ